VEVHDQSYIGPDGSVGYQEWRNRAFFDGEGKVARIYAIGFDITERKRTEETIRSLLGEKEVLLREVHHRVKNNMSTIRSLLSLEEGLQREESAKEALREASARVNSMAVLYDKLYSSENYRELRADGYLSSLIDEIVAIFPNKGLVRVDVSLEALILDAKLLYPLGIIINELITNSMKYAFGGQAEGLISIRLSSEGDRACLEYEDNGIGLPQEAEAKGSRGFGMELVGLLASQIGAAVKIERGPRAKYRLEFDRRA
jgi:two-component sensor histidine kinase